MTGHLEQARLALALRRRLRVRRPPRSDLVAELRRHALDRSPFYQQHHAGLEAAPLAELPPVTKTDLVDRLEDLVVDARVRRDELDEHLVTAPPGAPYRGYHVGVTSGSTGRPAALLFDRDEWVGLLANAAAAQAVGRAVATAEGAGRGRAAKVGSSSAWHLSTQVGATLADPRRPTLRLPATTPLLDLVAQLDDQQPEVLTAYPSVLGLLAGEQLAGRLHLGLHRVLAGGELLTADVRGRVRSAWGAEIIDQYVLGEAGFVAVACGGEGLHVLEEHVVVEVVDDDGAAVAGDGWGTRVLLTALASRTVPLIRYEVADRARWVAGPCSCGRGSARLLLGGQGRSAMRFATASGDVDVHPVLFSSALDAQPVGGWQVRRDHAGLRLRVTRPRDGFDADRLARSLTAALRQQGIVEPVQVEVTDQLERGAGGKAALVVDETGRG